MSVFNFGHYSTKIVNLLENQKRKFFINSNAIVDEAWLVTSKFFVKKRGGRMEFIIEKTVDILPPT
jgi:acetylornithine/succinyldiaminopimelate/putrescine aminotransferase